MMARLIFVASFAVLLMAQPVCAQAGSGEVASFTGQLSSATQVDRIVFDVNPDHFGLTTNGTVALVFVLSSAKDSLLDPGLIKVVAQKSGGVEVGGPRKPGTWGSDASIAIVTLNAGAYNVLVRSQHNTKGAYRLDVLLAGDANGDLKVDDTDLQIITKLKGVKAGDALYTQLADVDRNGVINGGDRERARANFGASAKTAQAANPLEEILPPGALALVGKSSNSFNSSVGPLQFSLTGASFDLNPTEVTLTINGAHVLADRLTIGDHLLTANVTLADGRNDVSLKAYDTVGRPLYFTGTLWAGTASLQIDLVNPDGSQFLQQAKVVAVLSDDHSISMQATTTIGSVVFQNVPVRTILIKAQGAGNQGGEAGVIGSQGIVQVKMLGFGQPSPIDNNDFSQGTLGWDIGIAPVSIVPHVENIPGFFGGAQASKLSLGTPTPASIVDQDLMLGTAGEGEQAISRTFNTQPGTSAVQIRYRFITSEVPGGYFGSQYNDYFSVLLRSQQGQGFEGEQNSMNGLGLGAFDFASGSTDWREVTLPVSTQGDIIQVDIGVANVGDDLFDSQVVVDFVKEIRDEVKPQLAWDNAGGGMNLSYEVQNQTTQAVVIDVYWASGSAYNNRIGAPIFSYPVPAGTPAGSYGPVHISGNLLAGDPVGVSHLIAASSPSQVGALPDVVVSFGANADAGAVSGGMLDVVRDGLRAAGQSVGTITSTARTPADQARAMFQNLVNPAHTVAVNVQNQLALYAAPGDAVINVFVQQTAGMTLATILQNASAIRGAMEQEIVNQGPSNVSRHCADPNQVSVVDVSASAFNSQNGPLFVASVAPRTYFINEVNINNCYHLELNL